MASEQTNARAISSVENPAITLSVSAIWLSDESAGWQHVKIQAKVVVADGVDGLSRVHVVLAEQRRLRLHDRAMTPRVPRAVLRGRHEPRARVRGHLVAPRLHGRERGLLKRLLRGVEVAAEPQEAAHDAPALAPHRLVDERRQLRHTSRISSAPCAMNRVPSAHATASSMLAMRMKKTPPITSLLSRNGPSNIALRSTRLPVRGG